MGTINQKIRFTKNAVDDIELALNEKGVDTKDVPLYVYGNLIRTLGNGGEGGAAAEFEVRLRPLFWAKEYVAQNATYNMVKAIFQDEDIFYWIENNTDYLVKPNATRLDYTIEMKEA